MNIFSDYLIELKSIVMLSQFDEKQINLAEYVEQLEKLIMNDNKKMVDKKYELGQLHIAYQLIIDELLGLKQKNAFK
ncbi:hypothetical protein J2S13_002458 [Oikeobacillus pervagus]|uniref:Uncharacterized protein n=1 Tax=Oikeobacillus pervagus TaxID=1325931 RepID=A0AAJ1T6D6_9BACI|nr:hypothetical protein [Oikeobacillus pervagus]MDQ0216036.1 hypothetical protein [Oikeobacillus pervagus]